MLEMLSPGLQAWRSWNSARGVALVAIVALAVGIGSATAVYTVVQAVILRPLPYSQGERFAALFSTNVNEPKTIGSSLFPDLQTYRDRTRSFDLFGWYRHFDLNLTSPGEPRHVVAVRVTPELPPGLGVAPLAGEWFGPNATNEVVLSHGLWQRLGGDVGMIGKSVVLSGISHTVRGIMPPEFRFPLVSTGDVQTPVDLWQPLDPQGRGQNRSEAAYFCYARLKPGVTLEQADADVKRVAAEIAAEEPVTHPAYSARLFNLREILIRDSRPTLLLLFAATGLLLLITCANVAGLMVARSVTRARETAVRMALGATPPQLALAYFFEGLFVALSGAAVGVALAWGLLRGIMTLAAERLPRADSVALDWTGLLFAAGAGCLSSALAGMAPLWQALRTQPSDALGEGVRASTGVRTRRLSQALLVIEIALGFTLLAAGATLVGHLRNLRQAPAGFDPHNLLVFETSFVDPAGKPRDPRAQRRLLEAIERVPGVTSAALVNQVPLAGCCLSTTIYPQGRADRAPTARGVSYLAVTPRYFETLRLPLHSGRLLHDSDTNEQLIAVLVNRKAATLFWPDRDAIGAFGNFGTPSGTRFQVVGVVGDVRNKVLDGPTEPEVYLPGIIVAVYPMRFVVRSPLPALTLAGEIRRAIQSVDPGQPIHNIQTMEQIREGAVSLERLSSYLTSFFALAALILSALGVYGLVSHSVRQRTAEIGTRMALGAVGRDLLVMVVGSGLRLAIAGTGAGILMLAAAVWILSRTLEVQMQPLPMLIAVLIVLSATALSCLFPAWRATRVSPMASIRGDAVMGSSPAPRQRFEAPLEKAGASLLAPEFLEASRRSASFREAINTALRLVSDRLGAGCVMLLEQNAEGVYATTASTDEAGIQRLALPADGLLLNRLRNHSAPLPLSEKDLETGLRWARQHKPAHVPELENLARTGTRVAVGLRTANEILGVMLLTPQGRDEFSAAERGLLAGWSPQFALMIENARLNERVLDQEKMRRDLAMAADVQQRLLPERVPQSGKAAIAASSIPARTIGGDYYDFLDLKEWGDEQLAIAMADIAGKGISAALLMAVVQASLRLITEEQGQSLPQIVARMNRALHRSTQSKGYATFFYAHLDGPGQRLCYVNAGHNPPYLLRAGSGEIEELREGGMVIGLFPVAEYRQAAVDLHPGDVLIVYTDGVTEAMSPTDEEFGEERLKDFLLSSAHLDVDGIRSQLLEKLRSWMAEAPQHDDLTFMLLKMT